MTIATDGLFNCKPYKYTYADATARGAASGFVPADVGVLALQLDNASLWLLSDDSPVTWVQIGGSAGLTDVTTTKGDLLARSSSAVARLAVGSNGQALVADSAQTLGVAWAGEVARTVVGAGGGAPAFAGTWTHFDATNVYQKVSYYKGADGRVYLCGMAAAGTINTTLFTLPAGYRPAANREFSVASNNAFGLVEVSSAGVVKPVVGNNSWVSLDTVSFETLA